MRVSFASARPWSSLKSSSYPVRPKSIFLSLLNLCHLLCHGFVCRRDLSVLVMGENAFALKTTFSYSYRMGNLSIENTDVFSRRRAKR